MSDRTPIAIVGIGGLLPGAPSLEAFWRNVASGVSSAREVPDGRWILPPDSIFNETIGAKDRVYSVRGCYLDDVPLKSALGIALDADQLARFDPSVHVLLHAGHQAFNDGVTAELDRSRVGVIIGNLALPTDNASALAHELLGRTLEDSVLGRAPSTLHARLDSTDGHVAGLPALLLAKALGLGAGALALDAACASSLYALKIACDELATGRVDAMLTGGLSRPDSLYTQMGFCQLRALSPTGRCSPFDEKGDGLVVGEGAAIFLLKRLEDALDHGDRIHGIVRGIGLSNDMGGSLLAPSSEGQLRAMRASYEQAEWRPSEIDLIECHATGTPVGDRVEVESLRSLWSAEDWIPGQCVIGSVKSNIGHLLTAAGGAALLKTVLALRNNTLPPTANFSRPAPGLGLDQGPFRVLQRPQPWRPRTEGQPRRAAISAFGFGGINAHVLVEEHVAAPRPISIRVTRSASPAIAVVGMDAWFGPWNSLRAFQERVFGADQHSPVAPNHWWGFDPDSAGLRAGLAEHRGYFIENFEFPAGRFRIPPNEIRELLPQQLLMLLVAARALDDASVDYSAEDPAAGVFIGSALDLNTTNYSFRWNLANNAPAWAEKLGLQLDDAALGQWTNSLRDAAMPPLTANRTMGGLASIAASRIAREFRFGGPSFTLSAEDASGLCVIERAVRALQNGDVSLALAGAVDFAGDLRASLCRALEADGGETIGEGAAAVVLKRLDDAERDHDRVYAVIRGVGHAQGERSGGRALDAALTESRFGVEVLPFVESSHTAAMTVSGGRHTASTSKDVGLAGAASGMASFVKTCLSVYHEILPPAASGRAVQYWLRDRAEGPRRAAVVSEGIEGSGLAVVLEEFCGEQPATAEAERVQPLGARDEGLFVVEANTVSALLVAVQRLRAEAEKDRAEPIESLARSWWRTTRDDRAKDFAVSFVARSPGELLELIEFAHRALTESPDTKLDASTVPPRMRDRIFFSPEPLGPDAGIAFVYPGSGNQYLGMGRGLFVHWPEVLRKQDQENRRLFSQFQPDTFWDPADPTAVHQDHKAILFGQVALGSAVTELIERFGVRPSAVIGYSLGETAGLVATRAWTARDEMLRRVNDSTLFTEDLAGECKAVRKAWKLPSHKTVDWALGIIDRPAKVVRAALQDHKKVYSLAVNTLQECVVGGDVHAVERLVKKLDCEFFPLHGVTTVHCEVAKEVQVPYRDLHLLDTTPPKGIRYYSGAWGTAYNVSRESAADSVLAQAIYGIDYPKMLEAAYYDGARVFLEVGPGASCTRMIGEILRGRPHLSKALCYTGHDPVSLVLRSLAALIAERVAVDLSVLYGQETFAIGLASAPKPIDTIRIAIGGTPFNVPAPPVRPRLQPATPTPAPEVAEGPPPWFPEFPSEDGIDIGPPELDFAELVAEWESVEQAKTGAHAAFLRFSEAATAALAEAITIQLESIERPSVPRSRVDRSPSPVLVQTAPSRAEVPVALDRNQCIEFAVGPIAKVLGPSFAPVDAHPTRVRLPDEPLMLVDRILTIEGGPRSMTHGRVVTEHDVRPGAWYLDNGRIPTCIAVEAGQADLFLSGYLGIDFETRGLAVYRLLDAVVTFHAPLPEAGRTIRYDIRIERFFRQGETHLFRFNFDATVDGRPVLTMRDGCAGFFTAAALAAGQGIVRTQLDLRPRSGVKPPDWRDLVPLDRESYSDEQLDAFRRGDLAGCFGPTFANLPIHTAPGLPGGRMKLVDRILDFDPAAGRYGMGVIRGEMDVYPDDWFLTCHFVDDRVMPGTLMYECCLHTFRVMLARMGFVAESGQVSYGPVPGVRSQLKCRGQVVESTEKVVYEVELKEIGFGPNAYAIADALMYADGKPIVEITDLSVQLTGVSREYLEELWSSTTRPIQSKSVVFDNDSITAFAVGNPSDAFGDRYRVFDLDRKIARLPGPPYKFLDRITRAAHPQWKMAAGGEIEAEYDVPPAEWYFDAARQGRMPFAILLETALQPCGWFAAYMGSALTSDTDLRFRNLGGRAVQLVAVTPDIGTLTTRVKCTNVSRSGGMIIQNYEYEIRAGARTVYSGDTYFGFFSADALANQVGLRDANVYQPNEKERSVSAPFAYPNAAPYPNDMLRMVDVVDVFDPNGGPHGLGFLRAVKDVVPSDWFFKAHFYQDPVWPGSLGLEAFVQLLKYAAVERWRVSEQPRIESLAIGEEHRWTYRGQVLPTDHRVTVTAAITRVDDARRILWGEGYLSVDGRTIYHMQDFAVRVIEP